MQYSIYGLMSGCYLFCQYLLNKLNNVNIVEGVDTVVFDYGGVLAFHRCEPWQNNLGNLLGMSGLEVDELLSETTPWGGLYRAGKIAREKFWEVVLDEANIESNVDFNQLEEYWAKSYQIDERMFELALLLKKMGYQIAIFSNSDERRYRHIEATYHLSEYFDFIIPSYIHGAIKPNREIYIKLLKIIDRTVEPHKVLYIDDKERNIEPAIALGMQGYVFRTYDEFSALVKKMI